MQNITVLGSTGSIGISTLDVLARHPEHYSVYALTAHTHVAQLAQQCQRFKPQIAVVGSASAALQLRDLLRAVRLRSKFYMALLRYLKLPVLQQAM